MKPKRSSESRQPFEMTLANKITVLRIILIPVIVILLIERKALWAVALFAANSFTDFLDGLAARMRGEQTLLGAFLDPLADKLLLTAVYLTLAFTQAIDMWVFVVIFSRDLLIVLGWSVIYILTGSSKIVPRKLGKATTAVQMVAALVFIIDFSPIVNSYLVWLIVIFTIASVVDYIIIGEKRLGEWN